MTSDDNIVICPYCNSDNVVKKKRVGFAIVISILLFMLPLPFFKKIYHCFDCGKEWKKALKDVEELFYFLGCITILLSQ